jgi:hypothetical protein
LLLRNSQTAFGVLYTEQQISRTAKKAFIMLRTATLRFTAEGRLLGFDTGDWSMLLGGFFIAGVLALMV